MSSRLHRGRWAERAQGSLMGQCPGLETEHLSWQNTIKNIKNIIINNNHNQKHKFEEINLKK
jgi:hypothetical protein